ncbi:hypothetical protein ACHAXR_010605 [Thalassiosira sp. AJA248-18]
MSISVFAGMERECEAPVPAYGGGSNLWTWTWRGVLMQCRSCHQMTRTRGNTVEVPIVAGEEDWTWW